MRKKTTRRQQNRLENSDESLGPEFGVGPPVDRVRSTATGPRVLSPRPCVRVIVVLPRKWTLWRPPFRRRSRDGCGTHTRKEPFGRPARWNRESSRTAAGRTTARSECRLNAARITAVTWNGDRRNRVSRSANDFGAIGLMTLKLFFSCIYQRFNNYVARHRKRVVHARAVCRQLRGNSAAALGRNAAETRPRANGTTIRGPIWPLGICLIRVSLTLVFYAPLLLINTMTV